MVKDFAFERAILTWVVNAATGFQLLRSLIKTKLTLVRSKRVDHTGYHQTHNNKLATLLYSKIYLAGMLVGFTCQLIVDCVWSASRMACTTH